MNRLLNDKNDSEAYDELSNLKTRGTRSYQYQDPDDPGNDQMRLATFDDGSLLTYHYDANGSPTAIDNKFSALSYDNLNHLRQIVYAKTDKYWYDRTGLRVKKMEDVGGTWNTTYTMFEGDNPLMQEVYSNSGRIQVLLNIIVDGKILAQYKRVYPSTDSVVYFYLDNLGSRRVVLSSTPSVIDKYRYSAWGMLTQDAGADHYESYTGKDYDACGLIYFNARYYDPITGRFLTEDPSRKGVNWYAYCENDPINKTDPTGRDAGDKAVINKGATDSALKVIKAGRPNLLQKLGDWLTQNTPKLTLGVSADVLGNNVSAAVEANPREGARPVLGSSFVRYSLVGISVDLTVGEAASPEIDIGLTKRESVGVNLDRGGKVVGLSAHIGAGVSTPVTVTRDDSASYNPAPGEKAW